MEDTPTAPAPAPEAGESVAPNTNTNQQGDNTNGGEAPQVSPKAEIPTDQVEAWNRFMENNGGFEKAFQKVKDTIANPQPTPQVSAAEPVVVSQTQPTPQPGEMGPAQVAPEPYKPAEGFITSNEYFAKKYNADLAAEYPEIADYVNKGEYLKEATAMGMHLVDQAGNFNDKVIHQFLDMKKAAVAPAPTSTPITTTPTVDYVHQEGDITTQEMADDIMKQGNSHPRYAEAMKFTQERIFGKKPEPKQK